MKFHLVDKDIGLYVSNDRISRTPQFPVSYFTELEDGWYKNQVNDHYYRYDGMLQRILCQLFRRNAPKEITDEDFIQFSNSRTIY